MRAWWCSWELEEEESGYPFVFRAISWRRGHPYQRVHGRAGEPIETIELLRAATLESVRYAPGFVTARLHRSLDGTKVTM
jgi:hypothetical protein